MSHENFLKRGYQRSYALKQVDDSEVVIWKCNENVMSFSNHSSLFQVISAKYVIPILGFDCILSLFWVRDKRAGKYTRARETRRTAPIRKERRNFGKFIFCKVVTFLLPSSSSCLFVWFFYFFFYFVLSMLLFQSIRPAGVVPNSSRAPALVLFVWRTYWWQSNWV